MISTSMHSNAKKSRPDFALLHIQEIQKLGERKASGTTIRIYMALCAYAMNGCFCFPNYQTIAETAGLQSKTFQQIISRSLSWLSEHKFIEKSANKKSKQRYFLSFRNTILSQRKNLPSEIDSHNLIDTPKITKKQISSSIQSQRSVTKSRSSDHVPTITTTSDRNPKILRSLELNKSANSHSKKLNKSANIRDKQEKIISIPPLTPPKGGEDINKENFQFKNKDKTKDSSIRIHKDKQHTQKYLLTNPSSIMSRCMAINTAFKEDTKPTLEAKHKTQGLPTTEEKIKSRVKVDEQVQRCFDQKIAMQLPLNIEDIQVLQRAMQEDTQWYNWITGFHFSYFQTIMGYSPTDEEIKQAQSNWLKSEEYKQLECKNEEEKERIRLRNQKIEQQLGMNQSKTPHHEKKTSNTPKLTKRRSERKPRKRNRSQTHKKYNNFDGGSSHPEYWPVRPAVEKLVSDLIVQKQVPDTQESLYIRTYAEQNNEWFHWLRYHQSRIFEQVFHCQVTVEQQEQSHQIWNRLTLQNLGFESSQIFLRMK